MDLPELVRKYDMRINGVLHCGAHLAEEAPIYRDLGIDNVWWVEANPAVMSKLVQNLAPYGHVLIEALLWNADGIELPFHVTNYDGMSSSVLNWGTHPTFSPDTVFVEEHKLISSTVDTLAKRYAIKANFWNLDLQGVEGWVIRGGMDFLDQVDYVMSEVNNQEVYKGCTQITELDDLLLDFERVETHWVGNQGWGDAIWIKRSA